MNRIRISCEGGSLDGETLYMLPGEVGGILCHTLLFKHGYMIREEYHYQKDPGEDPTEKLLAVFDGATLL